MNLANQLNKEAPLAIRMRPKNFDEFVGQEHIVGEGKLLRRAIESDSLQSVIFYGPAGCGKTALAELISQATSSHFEAINAVMAGVADIKKVVSDAQLRRSISGMKTVMFIDEIHRFNKTQQDALLPFVENGLIILVGATTENPMVSVNNALLSRTRVFKLEPLNDNDMRKLIDNSLKQEKGLGRFKTEIVPEAIEHIINSASGDARFLLNALEFSVLTTKPNNDGTRHITLGIVQDATQKRVLDYDKDGQEHYDVISAFIKSMRGSDPQAVAYWLAKMIYAGEDSMFIARRLVICASEDVGLADSNALIVASAALDAVKNIGMPEARIILAHAAIYIALAPKSNSAYLAINKSFEMVGNTKKLKVPIHLRDKNYNNNFGNEIEVTYKYPHDYPEHKVEQQYLPDEIKNEVFYVRGENDKCR